MGQEGNSMSFFELGLITAVLILCVPAGAIETAKDVRKGKAVAVAINEVMLSEGHSVGVNARSGLKVFYTSLDNDGMGFFEAIRFCFQNDLFPAVITSAAEDQILLDYLVFLAQHTNQNEINSRPFYLTLNDIEHEGEFKWMVNHYNESTTYRNWAPGSPRPAAEGGDLQDCVSAQQMSFPDNPQKFGWINLPCSTKWRPLCEAFYDAKANATTKL